MTVNYTLPVINARLQAVADAIDSGGGNGSLILTAASATVSTISLARPCGTVNGGVLTFSGTLLDPSAVGSANPVDSATITNSAGVVEAYGLTVGVPPSSGYDILISNGINNTVISAGQTVQVLSAQITGS